ncbi:hypothetical protein ABT297_17770 [Dactylosporangium sp. NPDC000555]|uniref:hypothetical protein n=1 Tax=Dactylosporangium sp. NPDC000555 TaxID=3154260 RepID=UPI00332D4829
MRTRTVAAMLGAVVTLGVGVDLVGDAGKWNSPAMVFTDHTTATCAGPSAPTASPRASCRRSACTHASPAAGRTNEQHNAGPAPDRRLKWHCPRRRPSYKRQPAQDVTWLSPLVARSAEAHAR